VNEGARIQSGTLTVEFLSDDDGNFATTGDQVNLASTSDPIFELTNAQPGDTQEKYLRIQNTGSILMNYDMKFDVVDDEGLGSAIVVEVEREEPVIATQTFTGVSIDTEVFSENDSLDEDEFETYRVSVTFDTSAGNEFQGLSYSLDLYLAAYQASNVASKPVFVSTIGELTTAASAAVKGTSIVLLNSISASSTSVNFTQLVNLNLRGFTLTLSSLSVTSSDFGFMRFENGIMNLVNYTVNAPSATLTHAVNLTINVSGASNITISNNTYMIDGILQTGTLSALSNSRLSISSAGALTATTLTVGGTASILLTGTLTATTLNIALTATVVPQATSTLNATTVTGGAQILPVEGATLNVPAFTIPVPIESDRILEAFTKVSQVDLSKQDGQGTFTFNYELDGDGKITGEAKTSLDAQVPGAGGFVGYGYHEILAERPNSNVTHYAVEGLIGFTHVNTTQLWPQGTTAVTTTPSGVGSKWYLYVARGYTSGTGANGWVPFGQNYIYTFTIKWYQGIGNLVSSEKLVVNFVNNSTQA
jgi:hypothetical protein